MSNHTQPVDVEEFSTAVKRISGNTVKTPMVSNEKLSQLVGHDILVKAENLQVTGSFKIRGALNAISQSIESGENVDGFTTFSAGNHAIAVAYAATVHNKKVVVCMPHGAVDEKVATVRQLGAEVIFSSTLLKTCDDLASSNNYKILPPFDSPHVIAGQGTVGLEIAADVLPDLDKDRQVVVMVPIGGGGLIAGVAAAIKTQLPGSIVIGVEPEGSNVMSQSRAAGRALTLKTPPKTIADGLAAPMAGELPFKYVEKYVDDIVEVSEDSIKKTIWPVLDALKLVLEPAAIAPYAALLEKAYVPPKDALIITIASGGNIGKATLKDI